MASRTLQRARMLCWKPPIEEVKVTPEVPKDDIFVLGTITVTCTPAQAITVTQGSRVWVLARWNVEDKAVDRIDWTEPDSAIPADVKRDVGAALFAFENARRKG